MKKDYRICGVNLRISAPMDIVGGVESEKFNIPCEQPDFEIALVPIDRIPKPNGQCCRNNRQRPVYREKETVSRITWDAFRPQPHMRVDYRLTEPNEVQCFVRQEDWMWATKDNYLWSGIGIQALLLQKRAFLLHAALICWRGEGILFTAPSRTGKSTQAELWRKVMAADIINGDKAGISLGERVLCHGVPLSGTSNISRNVSAPLKAIVVVSQARENVVARMNTTQAIEALYPNVFVDRSVVEEAQMALQLVLDVLEKVPVYHLACTPDRRAVDALAKAIAVEESYERV